TAGARRGAAGGLGHPAAGLGAEGELGSAAPGTLSAQNGSSAGSATGSGPETRSTRPGAGGSGPSAADTGIAGPPAAGASHPGASPVGGADESLLADAFGLELLKTIGNGSISLNAAWRLAGERHPALEAGSTLALAMNAVASLLAARLVVIGSEAQPDRIDILDAPLEQILERAREMDGWLADGGPGALRIARA
ncbi:MAG: hypothetical protein ACYCX7_04245, partial [Solirubrobacteraceae bacterium]